MSNSSADLSPSESKIVNKLADDGEVAIKALFRALRGRWPTEDEPHRRQQQIVGSIISRTNRKLKKTKIVPGIRRGTYRMIKTRA